MADASLRASGIYAIRNVRSGKRYVGSAVSLAMRFKSHRSLLRLGAHHSRKLQRAWDKHGEAAFVFEVVEFVSEHSQLIAREQAAIDLFGAAGDGGYNILPKAGSNLGMRHTDEARRKIGAAFAGKPKNYPNGNKGKKLPAEWVARVVAANTGKTRTEETKAAIGAAARGHKRWLGRTHSAESLAKMAAAARMRTPRSGWSHSDSAKQKVSQANSVAVVVDGVRYASFRAAAAAIGCHPSNIGYMVKSGRAERAGV